MALMYVICVGIILFLAFKTNVVLGAVVVGLIVLYGIYKYIPTYWAVKGQKAFDEGDFQKSRDYLKKAMDTKRAKLQIRMNYVYVLMRTGNYDEAERLLDQVIRVNHLKKEEFRSMAIQQRCMIYYKTGRLDEAVSDAQELFDSGYRNTVMYAMIGFFKLLKNEESIDDITKFCEEAYEYNDEDRDIRDNLSICYFRQGKYDEAKVISDQIIADSPKFVEAYFHGAQIAHAMGDDERALELLDCIPSCRRSEMTTVSEEDVERLKRSLRKSAAADGEA